MKSVGYLVADPEHLSPEEAAGWKFLLSCEQYNNTLAPLTQLSKSPSILKNFSALWWHYDTSTDLPPVALNPSVISALRSYVERGGSLFLSLLAAQYVVDLRVEEVRPDFIEKGVWNRKCWAEKYPDIRGLSSFRGHPIFSGLHGAAYTWSPKQESNFAGAFYNEPTHPKNGHVIAVAREYIKLNEDWKIAVEYQLGKGRILTVGSFLFLADEENRFRPHLELLTGNCLKYLASPPSGKARSQTEGSLESTTHWCFDPRTVRFLARRPGKPLAAGRKATWHPIASGLTLSREQATENFFNVGGRRILIMGSERSGIEEVWAHPLRILRNVRMGFKIGGREMVWAEDLQPKITVTPESFTRTFAINEVIIEETTFASLTSPGGAIHVDVGESASVEIILTAIIDLRIMWPLSEKATGSLSYSWDEGLHAVVVASETAGGSVIVGSSLQPAEYIMGRYSEIKERAGSFTGTPTEGVQVAIGLRYVGNSSTGCTFAFAGSSVNEREATKAYRSIVSNPLARLNEQARHFSSLLGSIPQPGGKDSELNTAFHWAVTATDRFFVETPGVGTSLMAGYATTRSGWNGGHAISGRPGYAWYFGRDSVWTALAVLAYGDNAKVKAVLEFLGNYQDITGKIAHEITTSDQVHYDAADATPLYVVLMGRYLRSSYDTKFVKREFPRLLKAIAFCFSTDTDGDHLIENTNVGHGWIEGGPLFPVHAELYLNACWAAALEEAGYIAGKLRNVADKKEWSSEARRIRRIINDRFWNQDTGYYNFAMKADGTFNATETILPTVAMYFGLTNPKKTKQHLRKIASERFSTEWGVRMIPSDDTKYSPAGYHYGSIWPLFTGWAALAMLRHGLPKEGLKHLTNTLMLYKKFALGYIPEVLHGERCEPSGVCNHQAWSEALAVLGLADWTRVRKKKK